jgi:NAD(P)-dependent dehydrogenase (short-subunit alcohol dehydrogenase family)
LGAKKLTITARDTIKGQIAKDQIECHARNNPRTGAVGETDVEVYDLDMSSHASVRAFADRATWNVEQLDAVILDAGQTNRAWSRGVEGQEQALQVNTISTTLLAVLLLPKLLEKPAVGSTNAIDLPHLAFISSGPVGTIKPTLVRKYSNFLNAL